ANNKSLTKMHAATRLCLLSILFGVLTACSTAPPVPEHLRQAYWQEHQTVLTALPDWTVNGSISAETREDDWSARVNWKHGPDKYKLRIYGPLGQNSAVLRGNANGVTLRDTDGRSYAASDPQTLMRDHFAIDLPVTSLRYWIRGLPAPDFPIITSSLNNQGRLAKLIQADWRLTYQSYRRYNNRLLPRRIRLENSEYQIEIVISKWLFSATQNAKPT
ncbi:MAG: lipoprotein insertase outer membrane protein LolB, partial [Pseudomonadota bacterium]